MIYKFNNFTLDTTKFTLVKANTNISIEPQVFNIILYLVENKDKIVSRQELLDTIWKGKIVSDASISNHIKSARKVLDDDGIKQNVIKTIHGRGYQFIALLKENKTPISSKVSIKTGLALMLTLATVLLIAFVWFYNQAPSPRDTNKNSLEDKSIAVLAFKDLSPQSDQEYFSDGISEELLNVFTQIPNLRVASRTSSFSFKNKQVTIKNIGKELNVRYIMEGSVRKSGEKIRITAQLIRVKDGSHIWSETYDHTMDDIFKIQDNIATQVTKQLKINLNKENIKVTPVDSHAYTLFLQAKYLLKENTEHSIKKALNLMGESISIDPNYAPAWTVYSRILYTVVIYSYKKENKGVFLLAKQAAIKALEADPNYSKAYAQMTLINLIEWDMEAAQTNIDKAMELNDQSSTTVGIFAYHSQLSGQLAKNVAILEQAIKLDPLNDIHYLNLGIVYLLLYRLDEALVMIEKYEFFHPNAVAMHAMKSHVLLAMNKTEEAFLEANKEVNEYWKLSTLGFVTYAQGDLKIADKILNQLITEYGKFLPGHIASHYAFRGDADNAFNWLEKSYSNHDSSLIHIINFQTLRPLWSDPRWNKFIHKIGLAKGHWLLEKRLDG